MSDSYTLPTLEKRLVIVDTLRKGLRYGISHSVLGIYSMIGKEIHDVWNHKFNPFHVYCRLMDLGLGKKPAAFLTKKYEHYIYKNGNSNKN